MGKTFESAVTSYLKARSLSPATGVEYRSTLSKWSEWGKKVQLESIGRADVREFLDWVHERAIDLVLFFNYGLDTGTVWKWKAVHEPILWRNVTWSKSCPDGRGKKSSP